MPFPMEHQLEPEWCWNAVAVSIEHYFKPNSKLTQPGFAVDTLHVPLDQTDRPFFLETALSKNGNLQSNRPGLLKFEEIQAQLVANLPVGVQIAWKEGGFHFVLITGYQLSPTGASQVLVSDPILKDSNWAVWDYDAFCLAYDPTHINAEGSWVETYFVKP